MIARRTGHAVSVARSTVAGVALGLLVLVGTAEPGTIAEPVGPSGPAARPEPQVSDPTGGRGAGLPARCTCRAERGAP